MLVLIKICRFKKITFSLTVQLLMDFNVSMRFFFPIYCAPKIKICYYSNLKDFVIYVLA